MIHAGTVDGWVPGALFLRRAAPAQGFPGSLKADSFRDWFENWLLPALLRPSLIIMDNASFHRKQSQTISSMTVADMRERLTRHGVEFDAKAVRDDLVELVKTNCEIRPDIEAVARARGHEVLWLPPYHPDLNPIERMWGVVKNNARRTFTMKRADDDAFLARLDQAFSACTAAVWRGSVDKSWKAVKSYVNIEQLLVDAAGANLQQPKAPIHVDEVKRESKEAKNTTQPGSHTVCVVYV